MIDHEQYLRLVQRKGLACVLLGRNAHVQDTPYVLSWPVQLFLQGELALDHNDGPLIEIEHSQMHCMLLAKRNRRELSHLQQSL